ncbi:DUF1156 domain-containing protein [Aeoliella sp. SH292]|uniref:DUF1156 domain-containing protein n=1 Tax=Aeoliella sp. SH292 TaxID=3454464 RepID=UPI003F9DAEA7
MTKEFPIKSPRKLIEVALPLDSINEACAHEKSVPRKGHPATFHLWWARRPLAAARAVIFAQMVNDPGYQHGQGFKYGMNKKAAAKERKRLFDIIEELVKWENVDNQNLLDQARTEIRRSWREVCELNKDHPSAGKLFNPDALPEVHDPFAGGGTIPLEAQRLGIEAFATDLNPVAVLINKALVEVPPKFKDRPPVNPDAIKERRLLARDWKGATGLAADVRFYGKWLRDSAAAKCEHLFAPIPVTREMSKYRPDLERYVGRELTVIAWIWARTVRSPNPAFNHVHVPLASTFMLSTKKGKEAYIEPLIDGFNYTFVVRTGKPKDFDSVKKGCKSGGSHSNFACLLSGTSIPFQYIRDEGVAGKLGERLMAVVVEGDRQRVYLPPSDAIEAQARKATPEWKPELDINYHPRDMKTQIYGLTRYCDLFTERQLVGLSTLCDLIMECRSLVKRDAIAAGLEEGDTLDSGGTGATAYADAISTYLAFALSKQTDWSNSVSSYIPAIEGLGHLFSRQAIPMVWDYIETNIFSNSAGNFTNHLEWVSRMVEATPATVSSVARQFDAASGVPDSEQRFIYSTDPPYYDNIGYADLSDFFYVWLRRSLRSVFPDLFATVAVPKAEELVATPYRHGSKEVAEEFFLKGMTSAFEKMIAQARPTFPTAIYYAFKQSETSLEHGTSSTGWETFLEAVIKAGLSICGTWPMRTERAVRSSSQGKNALASSVILVCRPRETIASAISRRDFIRELNEVLPEALDEMTRGVTGEQSPVAPVDLSQAIIGPGMSVYSKYSSVLEADGSPMTVRTALQLINRFLAEDDFDADTQFCLHWFEQYGWNAESFGEADVLARAKSTSVSGLADAGVLKSGGGFVQLLRWNDYPADWNPQTDTRIPIWEVLHQLIRALRQGGESSAGKLLAQGNIQSRAEASRQLAYRLYTLCERKGWAEDARAYNELITSWSAIESSTPQTVQTALFE